MLLDNFHKSCQHLAGKTCGGGSSIFDISYAPSGTSYFTSTMGGWYVDIGFSDTAESFSEYKLVNSNSMDNSSLLTWVSSAVDNSQPYIKCITSTYINNTGNDVIVKEIGIIVKNTGQASGGALSYNYILARKVLDIPVTIHDGESYAFTYSISI
jgi:hypothetical protein